MTNPWPRVPLFTVPIQVFPRPYYVALTPDGSRVYVSHVSSATVCVIDINSYFVSTIPVDYSPARLAVTPDGGRVYVANTSGLLSVINTTSNAVIYKTGPFDAPYGVAMAPDGRHVYVTNMGSGKVSVVDTLNNTTVANIPVGTGPQNVAVAPDGRHLYVTNSGSKSISVIDTATNAVASTVPLQTTPGSVAAPSGNRIYVNLPDSNTVLVIDTITSAVVRSIPVGSAPTDVAVAPDGRYVYVTNSGSNSISVIDTAMNAVVTTVPVERDPAGIAVTAHSIYVANYASNTVSEIRIDYPPDQPTQHVRQIFPDRAASGPPTACTILGADRCAVTYRSTYDELTYSAFFARGAGFAGGNTNIGSIEARPAGNPFAYLDLIRNIMIVLYRDGSGTVRSSYLAFGDFSFGQGQDNLSGTARAPNAAGDPIGYYVPAADTHHVIYRTSDGNLHELNWIGVAPVNYGGNLTGAISAPHAAGDPTAFVGSAGYNIVAYRSVNGDILSLYWLEGGSGLDELSVVAGTPKAAGDPFGYYTAYNDTHQIVYRAGDGHIYELYWAGNVPVTGWDIMPADALPATGNLAAYYSAGTNTKHVFYRSAAGRLHEIWWVPGGGTPAHVDLNDRYGAPLAADRPAAFTVEGPNTQHVAYRGTDNHIYEVIW